MSARDIFGQAADQYTRYRAELRFRGVIVGGIPSDKSVIEGWLRSRMELGDAAIEELLHETFEARGGEALNPDEAIEAVMGSELAPSINGFKRADTGELCIEGRIVKAALKEWMNSAYPGTKFPGKTKIEGLRKGLMRYAAETVFVDEPLIGLGVKEPTRVEERIKHVMTPQGPRSSINRVEVVEQPAVEFTVKVRDDFLPQEAWGRIWSVGEEIGLGADRARSDGRFTLERWERA